MAGVKFLWSSLLIGWVMLLFGLWAALPLIGCRLAVPAIRLRIAR